MRDARRNLRLRIAYDGTDFHGWQRQPNVPTIQETIEDAIARVTSEPVALNGSGRTDAGAHALAQVANFIARCPIPCPSLQKALNDVLPPTIRIVASEEAHETFHARYDARAKTYRYRILRSPVVSPFLSRFVAHVPGALDLNAMRDAAHLFEGEHDFTSFAASLGDAEDRLARNNKRLIFSSQFLWRPRTQILIYEARGNGFLPHMVRTIAGTLLEVGRGRIEPANISHALRARDRSLAGPTAPAKGLVLVRVEY